MISLAVILTTLLAVTSATASLLDVAPVGAGGYEIRVDGEPWLASNGIGVHADGRWFQTSDKSLVQKGAVVVETGADSWGEFRAESITWTSEDSHVVIVTTLRTYPAANIAVFQQSFPFGLNQTSIGSQDGVISFFPAFDIAGEKDRLGYVTWHGEFIDDDAKGPHTGMWHGGSLPSEVPHGVASGPICFFNRNASRALAVMSASNFMAGSMTSEQNQLRFGLLGTISSIPEDFSYEVMIAAVEGGVTNAMMHAGSSLLARYGKSRDVWRADYTVSHLGYNTDNGAFYYYHTESGKNYLDTLIDVSDYAARENIPYKWALLDSWWYFKGPENGVLNWTAMDSVFPGGNDGILELHQRTGWGFIGHNRYWSHLTNYAKQNGGDWDFIVEDKMAIPLEAEFWDFLLSSSAKWGLMVYEQDWLFNEFQGLNATLQSATLGRQWLLQMGQAAARAGLTVQYCMPFPRHALQSVELPAVTQIRNSVDYVPGVTNNPAVRPEQQWRIGESSILAHALGLAPFKDNFWSSKTETGNPRYPLPLEPHPALEAAVATLSCGPVTPSDAVNASDVALIMRSCRADGTLLQPSRPALAVDSTFVHRAFGESGPHGEVWTTFSEVSGLRWNIIFAGALKKNFELPASDLAVAPIGKAIVYSVNPDDMDIKSLKLAPYTSGSVTIPSANLGVTHIAPVLPNGYTLLGELAKWVPVSASRFSNLGWSGKMMTVSVSGSNGERVVVSVVFGNEIHHVVCDIPPRGVAILSMPQQTCE